MTHFQFLFALLILSAHVIAQGPESKQIFKFEGIGWEITPPVGFQLIDSSSNVTRINSEVQVSRKRLIYQNNAESFSFSITNNPQKGIDWKNVYKKEANHFFELISIQKPTVTFDSISTIVLIDSLEFNKFLMTGKENGQVIYNHVQLSKYLKGYRINIAYNYINTEIATVIEKTLQTIKFIY